MSSEFRSVAIVETYIYPLLWKHPFCQIKAIACSIEYAVSVYSSIFVHALSPYTCLSGAKNQYRSVIFRRRRLREITSSVDLLIVYSD